MDDIRLEMETHYFGTLQRDPRVRSGHRGATAVGRSSMCSRCCPGRMLADFGAYCGGQGGGLGDDGCAPRGARAARHPCRRAARRLHGHRHGGRSSPPTRRVDPAVVAAQALDGLFAGEPEILADELTRTVKAQLSQPSQVATL